ncbi:MAG: AtpZ/AtpI family protein [Flavobacteriales bacterium]
MTDQQPPQKPPQRGPNPAMRYTGMATQMAVTIGLGVWGGIKLDEKFPNKARAFTLTLSLLSVVLAMYLVMRDFMKKK